MDSRAKIGAVVALVAVNAVLLVMLNNKMDDSRANLSGYEPASSAATATPTPKKAAPDSKPGGAPGLALAADGTIVRTLSGSCDQDEKEAPALQVSTDGGQDFDKVDLPDITRLGDVRATSKNKLVLTGTDDKCQASIFATSDGGDTWKQSDKPNTWLLEGKELLSPAGKVETGCTTVSVAAITDQNARVLCDNGDIRGTDDTGSSWIVMGKYAGAQAAVFPSAGQAIVLATGATCEARVWTSADGGANWTPSGCAGNKKAEAFAYADGNLAALVNGELALSSDNGATWTKP